MKRLWGIRHIRYLFLNYRMHRWYAMWAQLGYFGPNQSDLDYLTGVWRGEL